MDTIQQKLIRAEAIINEVKILLPMQKEYFKTRDKEILMKCKNMESKVTKMIEDYFPKQPMLWDQS